MWTNTWAHKQFSHFPTLNHLWLVGERTRKQLALFRWTQLSINIMFGLIWMVVGGADVFAGIQSVGQTGFAKQNHNYCQRSGKPSRVPLRWFQLKAFSKLNSTKNSPFNWGKSLIYIKNHLYREYCNLADKILLLLLIVLMSIDITL